MSRPDTDLTVSAIPIVGAATVRRILLGWRRRLNGTPSQSRFGPNPILAEHLRLRP